MNRKDRANSEALHDGTFIFIGRAARGKNLAALEHGG
jgi:hypothetical protein